MTDYFSHLRKTVAFELCVEWLLPPWMEKLIFLGILI